MSAKKTITIILVVLLVGALVTASVVFLPKMLSSADEPTNTLGVSDTTSPGGTESPSNTPDVTTTPDPTPNNTTEPSPTELDPSTPDIDDEKKVLRHTESLVYNEEVKADYQKEWGTTLEDTLDVVYEQYGEYININISKDAVLVALITSIVGSDGEWDKTIYPTPKVYNEVNELLKADGKDPLDLNDVTQSLASLWIGASIYFGNDDVAAINNSYPNNSCCFDVALSFARARCDDSGPVHRLGLPLYVLQSAFLYDAMYGDLFDIRGPIEQHFVE